MLSAAVIGSAIAASVPTITIAPGVNLPVIALGTGSGQKGDVVNATQLWLKAGGTAFDTAYNYQDEQEIAAGLAQAGAARDSVFLETKIPCGTYAQAKGWIADNLKELNVTYTDLLLIHHETCRGLPGSIADTWKALEEALSAGQTRAIGVSHFKAADINKLMETATVLPSVNQCSLSVSFHDDETIAFCRSKGITYQSFSPLCGGGNGSSCPYGSVLKIPQVIQIAASHNVSAAQVGLKWIIQQGLPLTTAIWREDYMLEDLDLWSWGNLTDAEMKTLSAVGKTNATFA
eukprot:TRINITY_DN627_c0_g1_i5.p1 TRINITY_DN627_c0_g1~~TRINITY_DN627_c0_g1_i5.p1  ORF type:complete len:314 (+),score=108.03 TRINITY_DN627_c0_g1_i5:75-944(+)